MRSHYKQLYHSARCITLLPPSSLPDWSGVRGAPLLGRLHQHRVAGGAREGEHPERDHRGEVEGRHARDTQAEASPPRATLVYN